MNQKRVCKTYCCTIVVNVRQRCFRNSTTRRKQVSNANFRANTIPASTSWLITVLASSQAKKNAKSLELVDILASESNLLCRLKALPQKPFGLLVNLTDFECAVFIYTLLSDNGDGTSLKVTPLAVQRYIDRLQERLISPSGSVESAL